MKTKSCVKRFLSLMMLAMLSGCGGANVDDYWFVTVGDPFFDDALLRLSISEKQRLGFQQPSDLMGFYFEGQSEACIVLLPRKRNVILHGPNTTFCYDKATSNFVRRI